jgi:hypothetical protein
VGDDGHGGSAREHVLTRFTPLEERQLPEVLDAAADAVETWMVDGPVRAAERFNAWKPRVAEEPPERPTGPDAAAPAPDPTTPDADGIVRSSTGWRRILGRGSGS